MQMSYDAETRKAIERAANDAAEKLQAVAKEVAEMNERTAALQLDSLTKQGQKMAEALESFQKGFNQFVGEPGEKLSEGRVTVSAVLETMKKIAAVAGVSE